MTRRLLSLLVLAVALPAGAHDADVIYTSLEDGEAGALVERVTLTGNALALLAPVDADHDRTLSQADLDARRTAVLAGVWDEAPLSAQGAACVRSAEAAVLHEGYVELVASFRCGPGELRQDFRFLRVLPSNYRVVLGTQLEGERGRAFAQGGLTSVSVPRPGAHGGAGASSGVASGLWTAGLDGLVAAFGVFVLAGRRRRGALLGSATVGLLLGLVGGTLLTLPGLATALLVFLAVVASMLRRATGWGELAGAAVLGLALGARSGGSWPLSASLGGLVLAVGAASAGLGWGLAGKRPELPVRLAAGAIIAVGFGLGFRLSALAAS